jgi:diphosphomevalonate decarboxylase
MSLQRAAAFAPANIALVKYWGKRDDRLNLPCAPSVSAALADLGSYTVVQPDPHLAHDVLVIDDKALDDAGSKRATRVLEAIRALAGSQIFAGVRSVNTVPTARGLASSASGMAALAVAAAKAYGLDLDPAALSRLARTGSGSAARSVPGGYALWHAGERDDGLDSYAERLHQADHWPLRVLVAHVDAGPKAVPSGAGMKQTMQTAPVFQDWLAVCRQDAESCCKALADRNFNAVARVAESNALRMHATMLWGTPPLLYWQGGTVGVIHLVQQLRRDGAECFFTIDAGPSVVVFVTAQDARAVAESLAQVEGVTEVLQTRVGDGARIVEHG